MKTFGLKPEHLRIIYGALEKHFAGFPDLKVWLFGSRAKGLHKENSDIDLIVSSRSKKAKEFISLLKTDLEESDLPYTVDVVLWGDMLKSFIPEVKKTRVPFWDPGLIIRHSAWRACPLGRHWVRNHPRKRSMGKVEDVDGHCRDNPSKRDFIKTDELKVIEELDIFQNAPKPNPANLGFGNAGKLYDSLIGGWTAYWNDTMKLSPQLSPSLVKLLIATESGFDERATPEPSNPKSARGLMQLMPQTHKILKDPAGELKDHLVSFDWDEAWDPSVSVMAGIRWLIRKRETASKKLNRQATWDEALLEYKGVLKQNPKVGKNPVIHKKIKEYRQALGL